MQTRARPVDRSNSTQSTGFAIIVLARRGRICLINLIRMTPGVAPDWHNVTECSEMLTATLFAKSTRVSQYSKFTAQIN